MTTRSPALFLLEAAFALNAAGPEHAVDHSLVRRVVLALLPGESPVSSRLIRLRSRCRSGAV
jgi:hypothetical protein